MIAPLSHMAGAMSPAMYRYIRSYIRFLLPRRDQPLEVLIRQLRFSTPDKLPHLERRLQNRYKPQQLRYYIDRLLSLFEEVLLDPLQPWNSSNSSKSDVAMQRKLLGGLQLAASGFEEPANHRIQEVMRAVESGQNRSVTLKLQASLYSSPESHPESSKVSEKMGSLVNEYLSVVKARQVLNEVVNDQIQKGIPPSTSFIYTGKEIFPEMELANVLNTIMVHANSADLDALQNHWLVFKELIKNPFPGMSHMEASLQARIGLSLLQSPSKFPQAAAWLAQAYRALPLEHPLQAEVFRYRIHLLLLEGKIPEAEKLLSQNLKIPQDEKTLNLCIPMFRAIIAFMKNDPGKSLQQIVKIPLLLYSDTSVRTFELLQYVDQGQFPTADCRLEAFRKLLTRRGEKDSRARSIYKILTRLNVLCGDFKSFQRQNVEMMMELSEIHPWTPLSGEWFPLEVWFRARLNQKPISRISYSWFHSLG
jgi:tetratricopeptide (TPR) repeat protein